MAVATITAKGQVTIPKAIREGLKIDTGDKIEIILTRDREAIIRPVSKKVDDMFCRLHRSGRPPVSIEAMKTAVKKRMMDKYQ
jgi:antitoxin PrlF